MLLPGELNSLSLVDAAHLIADGGASPVELTAACLQRIEALQTRVNAFITVTDDDALYEAGTIEADLARGDAVGPLAGVPIALKDLFDTAGVRTTAGSRFFADRIP
ncbi:MAG TPA: amidase family protein, partial [Gemmatimonadaceae bacterium]|nr:amidase family protein [Gemmatimonadaceae bacterium]